MNTYGGRTKRIPLAVNTTTTTETKPFVTYQRKNINHNQSSVGENKLHAEKENLFK